MDIMSDMGTSNLLTNGMNAYNFAPVTQPESREKHKNYVFVDEHNRHRRLKVMRACAACRRRKIKCDAATTNTWPCAPCVKQQLECVPPSSDKEGQDETAEEQRPTSFHTYHHSTSNASPTAIPTYQQQISLPTNYTYSSSFPQSATSTYFDGSITGSSVQPQSVASESLTPLTPQTYVQHTLQHAAPRSSPTAVSVSGLTQKSDATDNELANVLQELRIDQGGVAPYIANQQTMVEGPPIEEQEPALPLPSFSNSAVRIPVEMMPSDQQTARYFEYFFGNIHPYVPVLNRAYFYQSWQYDRSAISPLILEGIFACSAQLLGHVDERNRWLALAARHEEAFKDVPRLSTVQGLILVMKARETAPKRGYYYRSWMTIQYMIRMGKDLGLHTHDKLHVQGRTCKFDPPDCLLKSRVWHTLFQMELMVGGPQGRTDFSIDLDMIDASVPQALPGIDFSELKISQDQTYFVRLVRNVRRTAALYIQIKENDGDCATDSAFTAHNESYLQLGREFPAHLQVKYPEDGSPPSIPFHFVANLQAYHLLSVFMHYRPQLEAYDNYNEPAWKEIMCLCHSAATKICRLHEAIMHNFGLNGLLCMLRGVNTAIYTILSCTLLHLVAITSPDPILNENAKDYFVRSMRILEQCSNSWPVPQVQEQVQILRQAFSADLNKPFELKQNFPFGSPRASSDTSPPPTDAAYQSHPGHSHASRHQGYANAYEASVTPPRTTATAFNGQDVVSSAAYAGTDGSCTQAAGDRWDPSGVFANWRTAFNPSQLETPSPGMHTSSMQHATVAPTSAPVYTVQQQSNYFGGTQHIAASQATMSSAYQPQMTAGQGYLGQGPATSPSAYQDSVHPYVTPSMWQDAVAQSSGWKRRWDGDPSDGQYKRMR